MIEDLHTDLLFGEGQDFSDDSLAPMAVQEYLSALDFLRLAQRAMKKAQYHQAQAVTQSPYR